MSAWLVYAMMGIYPVVPGEAHYSITKPMFDRVRIQLNPTYYSNPELVIERELNNGGYIDRVKLNGKRHSGYFVDHEDLVKGNRLQIILK